MIYQPAEDSYLLLKTLKKYLKENLKNKKINKNIKILDIGAGTGIQAQACKNLKFNNILTADINKKAVEHLKKLGFDSIQSNLFENIKDKFNLLIFNPPYLQEDKREPKDSQLATTAGKQGYELIINFLKQAKTHLNKQATILLLFSSLSKPDIILNKAKELGYKYNLLDSQKISFEELYVYEFLK